MHVTCRRDRVLAVARLVTVQLVRVTVTTCDPPATIGQQFPDAVCHRESLRSETVKDAITVLTNKRIGRDTQGGPRVASALMKEAMREYGASFGNAVHLTQHGQTSGVSTYVCSTVCGGGASCKGEACEFRL
jgi:hypothetical protein